MAAHWTDTDARLLRQLREAARLDRATLARRASMSPQQLADLEDGGDGRAFYSLAIRAHKGHELLGRLGHGPAEGDAQAPAPHSPPGPSQAAADEPTAAAPAAAGETPPRRRSRGLQWGLAGIAVLVVALEGAALLSASRREAAQAQPPAPAAQAPSGPAVPPGSPAQPGAVLPATAIPATAVASAAPASTAASDCDALQAPGAAAVPPQPGHPGDYVHFESDAGFSACVLDAAGRRTRVEAAAGQGATLRGEPPFVVQVADWEQVRVFFQGMRVRPPDGAGGRALLLQAR